MTMTAVDLKEFYDTMQGRVVQRVLKYHLRQLWPSVKGLRVAGLGYPMPFLRPFLDEAERVIALAPMQQGAIYWPPEHKGLVSACNETELPIETNSIDRLVVIHTLDSADSMRGVLQEAWRVLTGQGRLILIVPNRTGVWARIDSTPFGHGTPYSLGQMKHFLRESMFVPETTERALFFPPASSRLMLVTAPLWEKAGHMFFNAFGGVNIVEATKQLYAGTPVGATSRQRFAPAPKPVPTLD